MDHAVGIATIERRWQSDRRAQPTTFWSALRFRGRRRAFRRAGEAARVYVDCPSQRVVVLLFFVVGASILDALCTLLFIQSGGDEANPLMSFVLTHGETPFVGIKMAATAIGAWFLAAHQYFPLAFKGLHALAAGYVALLFTHAVILLS